jgi:hypothetical protein
MVRCCSITFIFFGGTNAACVKQISDFFCLFAVFYIEMHVYRYAFVD